MSALVGQEPTLYYAALAARGADAGLGWVDWSLAPEAPAYRYGASRRGRPATLRGAALTAQLPPSALEPGDGPSAWEALGLLLAPAEWAVAARGLSWSPLSPRPALLARLVQVYGVPDALHGGDPDALARLAAGLPAWRHHRGTLRFTRAVLGAVGREDTLDAWCARPAAERVVLRRDSAPRVGALRVSGGFACVVGDAPPSLVTLPPKTEAPLDRALLRLLPVWAVAGAAAEPSP